MQGNVSFRVVKTSLTRSSTVRDLPDARACESGKTDQASIQIRMHVRMHQRYDAQRQSIIDSLDNLIFQLYTLSFFLAPALLPLLCRVASQFVSYKPREVDPKLSLRVWFFLSCASNLPSFWSHTMGAAEGHATILDFVGMGYPPTKVHLLLLDAFILFLQLILTTISYEKSLHSSSPSTIPDVLLPSSASAVAFPSLASPLENESAKHSHHELPSIVDLHLRHIINRLHEPVPATFETQATLFLPNTTVFTLHR